MKIITQGKKLKPISRDEYDKFKKNLPKNICLFCEYKKFQIVIRKWEYWFLVQPISPYFRYHTMLCTKRHIRYLNELNNQERTEFWKINGQINKAYKSIGIKKLRMQLHIRYSHKEKININEHLHIHYYRFKDNDFRMLVSKTAYKQNMKKKLEKFLTDVV